MFSPAIQDILTRRLQVLPQIIVARNLTRDWDELIASQCSGGRLALIDDVDTANALGDCVYRALKSRYECRRITLPRFPAADETALAEIMPASAKADMLVAIGSGTINDLVKYAAFKAGKPYLIIPTAASMNGYLSANASITLHGHKQSIACALPKALIADMAVLENAPLRLTQAGLGDSLARPSAQADWLLSHHLIGAAYDSEIYALLGNYEAALFDQPQALLHRDREAIRHLFSLLLLTGIGMTLATSSSPASGGEHMIAHAMNMASQEPIPRPPLHGEEIAITSLLAARTWEHVLDHNTGTLADTLWPQHDMLRLFGEENAANFKPLYEKKRQSLLAACPDGVISKTLWQTITEDVAAILIPSSRLATIVEQAGLPKTPEKLSWDEIRYAEIIRTARFTRDRVSWLDLKF